MNIQEISKEQMDSLKVLADTNVKVGEAKGALAKLKEIEVDYLKEREAKAVLIVDKVLTDSRELLGEALKNYQEVKQLGNTASSYAGFLVEIHESLDGLIKAFEEKSGAWEAQTKVQEDEFEKIRNQIKADRAILENDRKTLEVREEKARQTDKKLRDERETLDRAIKRLKQGTI